MKILAAFVLTLFAYGGLLLRYAPFDPIVTPRQKRDLRICYFVAMIMNFGILVAGIYIWYVQSIFMYLRFGMIVLSVLLTLVNILIIPGRIREHLFVFGVVASCNYLLMSIPNYLITLVKGLTLEQNLVLILLAYGLILLGTYWPVKKLICRAVQPSLLLQTGDFWNTVWFIPIALFGTRFLFAGGEHNVGGIHQLLSSALTGSVIIIMCLNMASGYENIRQRQNLEKQLMDQKLHYKQLQTRVEETRKVRHDLKHHIAAILHFVELDEKESVRSYCEDFLVRTETQGQIPYTGNVAADGVLYHYLQRAQDQGIQLQYAGTIRSPGVSDMDLCILLGNALDNALSASMTAPQEKRIQLISQSQEKLLTMVVQNTFDGKVEQGEEGLLSRKRTNAYGVGIQSMRSVCERYGGSLETTWDDHTFTVMIMLPLTE